MPQHLLALPGLQRVHEGQGPARLALHHQPHLRHLRRQPRGLLGVRPEHGLRGQDAAPGRVDHEPRRGGRVHLRPHHLPGQPAVRGLLRADGPRDQPELAGAGGDDRGPQRQHPRLPHHRRPHALPQPVLRRDLRGSVADEPDHPRDVLPDGGTSRPPLDDLSRRRRHGPDTRSSSRTTWSGSCGAWTG